MRSHDRLGENLGLSEQENDKPSQEKRDLGEGKERTERVMNFGHRRASHCNQNLPSEVCHNPHKNKKEF